ncbi:type I-E CRISPR-associated protein Cas6/Cse3/CasE [Nocardiopsis sp. CNT-189]|uniref:type I-E CRISPR-associated protein Cas6/Cse3/CasE n=1 Tax=Nocardiopsis oceanisediminis TaxID=2816862 RepID=UPI003B368EC9
MKPPEQLWLTRAVLTGAQAAALTRNASHMHRKVMAMFPDGLGDQARRTAGALYRLEPSGPRIQLLVQSGIAPDLTGFDQARTVSLLPLLENLTRGRTVHYRIAANPVKAVPDPADPKKRGTRKALYGAEAEKWWRRKAEQAGLAPDLVSSQRHDLASDPPLTRHKRARHQDPGEEGKAKRLFNSGVRFDGTAEITDPDLLLPALLEGIGRGRSYGLGMLSLAPAGRR